ncbi:uncharacterized protein LOC114542267 isoform X2 [Dendronephthya gigantea]|uniref:uncharacterized protein LOC114542267 isoform X2 n=1 Tax=Dendronephthya gigantea TaxID=151771 RepID=UPI00106AE793|nr:uncharacterized protein LOC114542267 isoform X2 [Dendronephthya gigantea]
MVREDRSTSSTNISLTESECHSDSQPQFSCDQYDENTTPEVIIDCQPRHSSLAQNTEANVEIAYATELSRLEMVTVVTKCAFVLPDFNVESKRIKEMNFIVVHRSVWLLLPTNQYDWLYSCSCSPRRSQLLSGLSKLLQQEPSHLRNSVCIHIKAICHLLLDYDSQHGITPEEQEEESSMNDHTYKSTTNLFGIQMNDSLIGISMHDAASIGVLAKQRDGSVKCIPCSSSQCEHAMLVKQWPMDDPDIPELLVDFLEQDVATGYSGNSLISPVSSRKIPFDLFGCQRRSFQNGPESVLPEVMDDEGKMFLALFPPFPALNDEPCQLCGNNFRDEDPRDKESWYIKSVKLYGKRKIFDCLVYKQPCSGENCVNDMKFDGYAYTVLNMGNYLISYEVLREYMFLFLKGGWF